jgi:CBS domain-containing protein
MDFRDSLIRDRVRDLQIKAPVCVTPDASIHDAIESMKREQVGCVLVQEGDKLEGLFTERDVLTRVLSRGVSLSEPVRSVMTTNPDVVSLDDSVAHVITRMNAGGYRHMPAVNEFGVPIGTVSVRRVVQYLVEYFPETVYNQPPDPSVIHTTREGG